jgi:ABC-type glycerol-3-phosphate transport system substrate-binding protein
MLRNILLGVGIFAALFSVLIFSGKLPFGKKADTPKGEVVLWGTLPEAQMNKIIQEFNPKAKSYRVTYKEVREDVFNQRLLEALANGVGPDVILAPYQTILAQTPRLFPFPIASMTEKGFKDTYVDGATIFFSPIYGAMALPVSVEPLVLFYNRKLFSKHGIVNPPKYWDEVAALVPQLTMQNDNRQFIESGISLGAPNTPYAKDILMTIVAQLGQSPVITKFDTMGNPGYEVTANTPVTGNPDVFPLVSASRYFVQFADPVQNTYSWNQFTGEASDQFVAEKLAMYLGYSGELATLRARNPRAEYEISDFPQTKGYNTFTTGMRMYGIATLKTSRNLNTALTVQSQFAGGNVAPALAAIVGGVPPFRQYANTNGLHAVIAHGMLVAHGWNDTFSSQSSNYVSAMIGDILNNRQGVNDAVNIFISRMRDIYNPF